MRLSILLASAALSTAFTSGQAAAAPVVYGLAFTQEFNSFDPRGGDPRTVLGLPSGTFTFDTATNQLLSFDVYRGYPESVGVTFNSQVLALFEAAGVCDITCFIGAIDGQRFSTNGGSGRIQTSISFGAPLNGVATSNLNAGPGPFFSFGGTYRAIGPVPEPGTWALMLLGFVAIGASMRRRRTIAAESIQIS